MRREQDIAVAQHALKGLITLPPSVCFDPSTAWLNIQHPNVQWKNLRVSMALAKIAPVSGSRMHAMINLNVMNRWRCGGVAIGSQRVKQRNAVSTTR